MIEQLPNAESLYIILIFIVALLVFVVMMIAVVIAFRFERQAGEGAKPKPRARGPSMNDKSGQTRRIDLLSAARWNGLAILGIIFVLLLLTEIALRSSLRRGWTNYTESESVSFLAVDSQGQVWAAVYDMNQYVRTDSIVMFPADEEPVHIPLPEALATDAVQFLKIDMEDRMWLGTVSGLLAVRDIDDRWRVFSPEHSKQN